MSDTKRSEDDRTYFPESPYRLEKNVWAAVEFTFFKQTLNKN